MRSHAIPMRLLEQFAFQEPATKSPRLWAYERGRMPSGRMSPRVATRIAGHFFHPDDPEREQAVEKRLGDDFEAPVNQFLFDENLLDLAGSGNQRKRLTYYIQLLFHRSTARRKASVYLEKMLGNAFEHFLANDYQIMNVAAKWSIERYLNREPRWYVEPAQVVQYVKERRRGEEQAQANYVESIEHFMDQMDVPLFEGEWNLLRAMHGDHYIVSDAPVATWERLPDGRFNYGVGFHRPDVEVVLPISPVACIHVQPKVRRNRQAQTPTVHEVNVSQAVFAHRFCFANLRSERIDEIVQQHSGEAELGLKSFTLAHRNPRTYVYEDFMGQRRDDR